MAINTALDSARTKIFWNEKEVADVGGLTPNALLAVLNRNGQGLHAVLALVDKLDMGGVNLQDKSEVAEVIMARGAEALVVLAKELPGFLAGLIATAAGDADEAEFVEEHWSLGLQFEALRNICLLTFNGTEGFRAFVGNVYALVEVANQLTKPKGAAPSPSFRGDPGRLGDTSQT